MEPLAVSLEMGMFLHPPGEEVGEPLRVPRVLQPELPPTPPKFQGGLWVVVVPPSTRPGQSHRYTDSSTKLPMKAALFLLLGEEGAGGETRLTPSVSSL